MKAPYFESKTHINLVKSCLCPLLVCEQAIRKALWFILKYRWRNLAEESNVFNTTSLICPPEFQPQTDEAFTVDGRKHTHTHTHNEQNYYIDVLERSDKNTKILAKSLKLPVKEFDFSNGLGLHSVALLRNKLLHWHFQRLAKVVKTLLWIK